MDEPSSAPGAPDEPSEAHAPTRPPDWGAIEEEIRCSLCEYNLRGIAEPRCPECGFKFEWPELLDPLRRQHPYLFDLQRGHWVSTFLKTALHGWRPIQFWKQVTPVHRTSATRLWVYGGIVLLLHLAACALFYAAASYQLGKVWTSVRFSKRDNAFWWVSASVLLALFWPIVNLMALSIFAVSMSRAKVRIIHVARCVIYSADVNLAVSSLVLFFGILTAASKRMSSMDVQFMSGLTCCAWLASWAIYTERLQFAYRLYLRFDRPWATVISAQIIVALAALTTFIVFAGSDLPSRWLL